MNRVLLCLIVGATLSTSIELSASRIVSLSPSSTEIIARITHPGTLVGVSRNCDYPTSVSTLPKVGDIRPNYEKLITLSPDYVIGIGNGQRVASKLNKLNLNTLILPFPNSISELKAQILTIGEFIGKPNAAKTLVKQMNQELSTLQRTLPTKKPKALLLLWLSPPTATGGASFVNELLTLGGLDNVMKDTPLTHTRLSKEALFHKQPDIVILANPTLETPAKQHPLLKTTQLVAKIDPNLFLRPGPRIIEGIKAFRALTK